MPRDPVISFGLDIRGENSRFYQDFNLKTGWGVSQIWLHAALSSVWRLQFLSDSILGSLVGFSNVFHVVGVFDTERKNRKKTSFSNA